MNRCVHGWAVVVVVGIALGCSSPPKEERGRATGTVTLDGKPLASGKLDLVSDTGSVSTPIGKEGVFMVPSLPAGKYKVAVGPVPNRADGSPVTGIFHQGDPAGKPEKPGTGPVIPKRYTDPATSGIQVEIGPTGGPLEIKLTTK